MFIQQIRNSSQGFFFYAKRKLSHNMELVISFR